MIFIGIVVAVVRVRSVIMRYWALEIGIAIVLFVCVACGRGHKDIEIATMAHNELLEGLAAAARGETEHSMEHLYEFVFISEDFPESVLDKDIVLANALVGDNYRALGDYDSACKWYVLSLNHAGSAGDSTMTDNLLYRIALCHIKMKNKNKAEISVRRFYDTILNKQDALSRYRMTYISGLMENTFGEMEEGVKSMHDALTIADSASLDADSRINPMLSLVLYSLENGDADTAFGLLSRYRKVILDSADVFQRADYMKANMRAWTLKDRFDSATVYQSQYFVLMDSVRRSERYRIFSENIKGRLSERQQTKIEISNRKVMMRHLFLTVVIVLAVCICIFFVWYHRFLLRKRRHLLTSDLAMIRLQKHHYDNKDGGELTASMKDMTIHEDLFIKVREILERPENFTNPDLSLPRVAEMVGTNTKYVSRAIKNATGYNFPSFVNSYRVSEARRRLIDDADYRNLTIQSIAESVGFKAVSTFIAAFRQFTGMTPSTYVKMGRLGQLPGAKEDDNADSSSGSDD